MEGKNKKKHKGLKISLIAMSFILTIVLTFSITYAWFFDSDWASNYVTMAGSVGIEIREKNEDGSFSKSSGAGQLHFDIATDDRLAYPGQAIDVSASVYNNGGVSANYDPTTNPDKGSDCYVRARFVVYTNIGQGTFQTTLDPDDFDTTEEYNAAVEAEEAVFENEKIMNATAIYKYLQDLITVQNGKADGYCWQYLQTKGAKILTPTGAAPSQSAPANYYLEGETGYYENGQLVKYTAENSKDLKDNGYYYLCVKDGQTLTTNMLKLAVGVDAAFLWDSKFIIPWTLTNFSADKHIFVAVEFQAIQTFIPVIESDGSIKDDDIDNQVQGNIAYDNTSLQTVFNSCSFDPINTKIKIDGTTVDFSGAGFGSATGQATA